jgi:hypothetical protein
VGSGSDSEESPGGGDASEFVFAAVVKGRARAGDEIDDGARHEYLAGLCGFADAMGEVHGDAGEFGAASFDFTGVDADPDFEADLAGGVADRGSAAEGAGGSVEGGEDAVTGESLMLAREPCQLMEDGVVVAVEHRVPGPVADGGDPVGGADHVGKTTTW